MDIVGLMFIASVVLQMVNVGLIIEYTRRWEIMSKDMERNNKVNIMIKCSLLFVMLFVLGYTYFTVDYFTHDEVNHTSDNLVVILFFGAVFVTGSIKLVQSLLSAVKEYSDRLVMKAKERLDVAAAELSYLDEELDYCIIKLDFETMEISYSQGFSKKYYTEGLPKTYGGNDIFKCKLFDTEKALQVKDAIAKAFSDGESYRGSLKLRALDGEFRMTDLKALSFRDNNGVPVGMVAIIEDINEGYEERKQLIQSAERDLFTGLYNKSTFEGKALEWMKDNPGKMTLLMMIDIDNFKYINDSYGHAQGDVAIKMVAEFVEGYFAGRQTLIGRFGGDEFVVQVQDINEEAEAESLIADFRQKFKLKLPLEAPFSGNHEFTGSVGYTTCSGCDGQYEKMFAKVDAAMYDMKERRKGERRKEDRRKENRRQV